MMIKEKLKDLYFIITGTIRNKKIENKNFTIISNNCFGGIVYRNFHIPYQSPTCGMFFMAPDYIKFIYNIKKYIYKDIVEIKICDSKYADYYRQKNYTGLIGKIDDIEVCLMHYNSIDECNKKWKRRSQRINWDRIIYKFNDQNLCSYSDLKAFENFDAPNKICFTAKKYDEFNFIHLEQFKNYNYVLSDTREKDYRNKLNIIKYLNNIQ